MSVVTTLAASAGGVGLGLGSALLPVVNAEAYVLVVSSRHPSHLLLVLTVVGVALGQTAGKVLLFEGGRHARRPSWLARSGRSKGVYVPSPRWSRLGDLLRRPRTGVPLVLASASLGLPPLAVVSVLAGAAGQRRRTFAALCLGGRLARFAVLAIPLALA